MKVWVPPHKAKVYPGSTYRWVLLFSIGKYETFKTICIQHSHINPRKTDTCFAVFTWIHSIILTFGQGYKYPIHPKYDGEQIMKM